jgi:hypothetical protein
MEAVNNSASAALSAYQSGNLAQVNSIMISALQSATREKIADIATLSANLGCGVTEASGNAEYDATSCKPAGDVSQSGKGAIQCTPVSEKPDVSCNEFNCFNGSTDFYGALECAASTLSNDISKRL